MRLTTPVPVRGREHFVQDLGLAVLRRVLHQRHHAPHPGNQVHRAAHTLDHLSGDHPIGQVPAQGNLHRAQNRQIDMPAADHRKRVRARKEACARKRRHRLLPRVDQIRIDLILRRERPNPKQPILRVQRHVNILRNVVGHQRRNADAEVDVVPVLQLLSRALRHLFP